MPNWPPGFAGEVRGPQAPSDLGQCRELLDVLMPDPVTLVEMGPGLLRLENHMHKCATVGVMAHSKDLGKGSDSWTVRGQPGLGERARASPSRRRVKKRSPKGLGEGKSSHVAFASEGKCSLAERSGGTPDPSPFKNAPPPTRAHRRRQGMFGLFPPEPSPAPSLVWEGRRPLPNPRPTICGRPWCRHC